MAEKKVWCYL